MPASTLFDVLKPYLWLTLAAFLAGFLSYVALGRPAAEPQASRLQPAPVVSAPVADTWNLPKHI